MRNENELLENKELREKLKDRIEILNKVGSLLLLPNTEKATTIQVATYYEVDKGVIENYYKVPKYQSIKEELESDGMKLYSYSEICNEIGEEFKTLQNNGLKIPSRGSYLFPKRAILRVGMLLRDSEIAKEIRTQLLNIFENTSDDVKVKEIDEEKKLLFNIVMANSSEDQMIAVSNYRKYMDRYKEKANYCDKVVSSPNGVTITQIAKEIGFKSGQALNKILAENKIQYKNQKGQWLLYSDYSENGYTVPFTYIDNNGCTHHLSNWTEKGKKFIYDLLKTNNLLQIN